MLGLTSLYLSALGGKPALLLSTMNSQLEAVGDEIRQVEDDIVGVKRDLAEAKEAKNGQERSLVDLQISFNNQLPSLNEKENILLSGQASGKHCFQRMHAGLITFIMLYSIQCMTVYMSWVLRLHMIQCR